MFNACLVALYYISYVLVFWSIVVFTSLNLFLFVQAVLRSFVAYSFCMICCVCVDFADITNFLNIALLLTMLFSTGEAIPLHQYGKTLDEGYKDFLRQNYGFRDQYSLVSYSL